MAKNKKKQTKTQNLNQITPSPETEPTQGNNNGQSKQELAQEEVAQETEADAPASTADEHNGLGVNELQKKIDQLTLALKQKDDELVEKDKALLKANSLTEGKADLNGDNLSKVKELEDQLSKVEKERGETKSSYDTLLSKLSTMKSVFTKIKESQRELEETKEALEELATENSGLKEKNQTSASEIEKLNTTIKKLTEESSDLNNECDRLSNSLTKLRREFQSKDESLLDEKYNLENTNSRLTKKINELKLELNEITVSRDEANMETKNLNLTIDELKDKLQSKEADIKDLEGKISNHTQSISERDREIESLKQNHESTIDELKQKIELLIQEKTLVDTTLQEKITKLSQLETENEKVSKLEADVNSKQLIIGKLRHEAIILNEHLTKSLTMLKQQLSNLNNTIDKELISNVVISFLQFPRGDTKKFEALQLISALLEWDESQKVSAGLSHNQQSQRNSNDPNDDKPGRQSFVSLWTDFLEKESEKK